MIVVADMELDGKRGALLRKHLERGGGLLMFGGPHVDPNTYLQSFFSATTPRGGKEPLARYDAAVGNLDDESTFLPITTVDIHHPVLSLFARGETDYFGAARLVPLPAASFDGTTGGGQFVSRVFLGKAGNPGGSADEAVRSGSGDGRGGAGSRAHAVVLVCRHAGLVEPANPGTVRAAAAAKHRAREAGFARRSGLCGSTSRAGADSLEPALARARVEATIPSGQIRPVELHPADDRLVGALMQTDTRGYYSFRVQPPTALSGEPTVQLGFAVNLDIDQAGFESVNQQQVEKTFADTPLTYISGTADDPVLSGQLMQRREIWRWLIWGMFAVIGIEFTLSTLKSGEPAERASAAPAVAASAWQQWTQPFTRKISRALGMGETVGKA